MTERIQYAKVVPDVYKTLLSVHAYLKHSGMDEKLLNLVYLRASQINGCAYCIDMHWKDTRASGESEQRLYMLNAWRDWHEYTPKERAALEWTEAVTRLTDGNVSDEVYEIAHAQFKADELVKLTLAITAINSWNRMNVAFRTKAGGYQPPALHQAS
jgi:AhpD family alkylhydroperoxidase